MQPRSFNNQEVDYPINRIVIGDRLRQIRDHEKVASIAQSMQEVGQISAIALLPDGELVAGAHRVAAAKLLGWRDIRAVIKEIDELDARLIEIDENLYRADLDVLEQAEHIQEREEILQAKGLRAARGGQPGNQNAAQNKGAPGAPSFSTTADIGAMMGLSERTIRAQTNRQGHRAGSQGTNQRFRTRQKHQATTCPCPHGTRGTKTVVNLVQSGVVETVKQAQAVLQPARLLHPRRSRSRPDRWRRMVYPG